MSGRSDDPPPLRLACPLGLSVAVLGGADLGGCAMSNSARNHTAIGIASGSHSPPTPPPPQEAGRPGPTYVAHDGHIWRRGMQAWDTLEPANPHVLLASFRQDATNTADWFHARAAELADELERAMRELGLIEPQEIAA